MKKITLFLFSLVFFCLSISAQTNLIAGWSANGSTDASLSKPNANGWACTGTPTWNAANVSGQVRYVDYNVTGGHSLSTQTIFYMFNGVQFTNRILWIRWDGSPSLTSLYTLDLGVLNACQSYTFSWKYAWHNNATAPVLTTKICSSLDGVTGTILTDTSNCSPTRGVMNVKSFSFTPSTTGKYYLSIGANTASMCGIADLSLTAGSSKKTMNVSAQSIVLSDANKTSKFIVSGNALTNNINITAPSSVTLNKNTVTAANAICGDSIFVTYNYPVTNVTSDTIQVSVDTIGGTITRKIPFTYVPPTLKTSVDAFQIEEGEIFPLSFTSVNNSLESIDITMPAGFDISIGSLSAGDFKDFGGTISLDVTSTAAAGTSGVILVKTGEKLLKSIPVKKVDKFARYLIKHNASGLVIGNHSTLAGVPSLTENAMKTTQKFFLRRVNLLESSTPDTVNIVQDSSYLTLRKVATSNWDVELNTANENSNWIVKNVGSGKYTLTNLMDPTKVTGIDALTADARLYFNKTYAAGGNTEWLLLNIDELYNPKLSTMSGVVLSDGILDKDFDPAITNYNVLVTPTIPSVTVTGSAKSTLAFVNNNGGALDANTPLVLSCISGDNSSTTNYTFTYSALGFSDWAAQGKTGASTSPNKWGWNCLNASWATANATTVGTNRFIDNPVGYHYYGDTLSTGVKDDSIVFKGRVLYMRWDGNVTTGGVYSYPVILAAGQKYTITGKYAWNSNIPVDTIPPIDSIAVYTFGVNSMNDNSGVSLASADSAISGKRLMMLKEFSLTFTPGITDLYYFTIKNDKAILGAIADLELVNATDVIRPETTKLFAYTNRSSVFINGTSGGETIKIYTVSGQLIRQLKATKQVTDLNLNTGVYLIKVNDTVLKVIK